MTKQRSAGAAQQGGKSSPTLDMDNILDLLGFHVRMANVAMYRDFAIALGDIDLTPKQVATLQLIGANDSVSQIDLAATLGMDRSTTMALIARLCERGLIRRTRSAQDGRRQELHLTDHGKDTVRRAKLAIQEHEARMLARLSKSEQRAIFSALRKLHQLA